MFKKACCDSKFEFADEFNGTFTVNPDVYQVSKQPEPILAKEQSHGFCNKRISDSAQVFSQVLCFGFHPENLPCVNVFIRRNVSNRRLFTYGTFECFVKFIC